MKEFTKRLLTGVVALGLLAPVATQSIVNNPHTQVQARQRLSFNRGGGYTVKLTRPVRVHFIKYYDNAIYKNHSVRSKVLHRGSILHAWAKGTEGVYWCVYGHRVHMNKKIWPSASLSNRNCKVLHHYKYRYGYEYTMKRIHDWY